MPSSVRQSSHPNQDPNLGILTWVGISIRIFLVVGWPMLGVLLGGRVEVSTPVTSYKRLRECVYLYTHGISPYDGGVCHQAPLLVALFEHISTWISPFVFIGIDYITSVLFARIAQYKRREQLSEVWPEPVFVDDSEQVTGIVDVDQTGVGSPSLHASQNTNASETKKSAGSVSKSDPYAPWSDDPTRPVDSVIVPENVGALHLLNPFGILSCAAQSTQSLSMLGIVASVYFASRGRVQPAAMALAAASYLSLYPILIAPPCVLLVARASGSSIRKSSIQFISGFVAFTGLFLYVSHIMVGDWSFLKSTYGTILFVTDLTPNVGLYWYFFIEMFDQFRTFFLAVFHLTAIIFSLPITIRFSHHPLSAVFLLCSITSIFKAYPSISDAWLYMSMATLFPDIFKYARHTFFALTMLIYASILGPLFYNLWVYSGAGNANFFYAITLVYALAQIIFVVDVGYAMLRREWERKHPGWRWMKLEIVQM